MEIKNKKSKNTLWKKQTSCRICGKNKPVHMLDLGSMPLANAFVKKSGLKRDEVSFPLRIAVCSQCFSVQLQDTVEPRQLFPKDYYYFTGASTPLTKHFEDLGRHLTKEFRLKKSDLVVEIGSNDGVLLSAIAPAARVLGVDPATNVNKEAKKRGIKTIQAFFNEDTAKSIVKKEGHATLILANNVFAHIPETHSVVRGIKELLSEDGQFIAEMHWVGNLMGDGGFDQIYHEHFYYFSLHTLKYLFETIHGLTISHVELIPIHGESLRIFVTKGKTIKPSVLKFLEKEKSLGLHVLEEYLNFGTRVKQTRDDLLQTLTDIKKSGKRTVGYGAPAKGNTLLNFCNIGPELLEYIVDTTPAKQGAYTPGSHIAVVKPETLQTTLPDYILLLSWNYAEAILKKEKGLRKKGVKFIIPVPHVRIV